ncbi:MAG: sortase, partial [Chloroflexi bacterium]|nr:sortase [Chloroflexota bacterium]
EGVTQSLVVTDNLPVGLVYVSHSVVTTAAASGGLLAADYNGTLPAPTVTAPGGSGDDLTLDFGNVTTAADNVTNNNAFVIFVTARVNNEAGNQNGTVLANTASLTYNDPDTGTTTIADPTAENVTVLEPELNIVKSADDTTPAYGQTLTYTLTVSHLASSTSTAYDIVITDTIPTGLTYVAGSISAPAGWTTNDTAAPTLTWTCSALCSLPVGNTASLSYQVTVNGPPGPPNPGDVLTNTASMTWTSLEGTDPNERTGADGVGGLNDYADSDPENVTLTAIDLTINKEDGGITSSAGGVVQYTLSYSNAGNSPASGVTITETVPANTTFNAGASTSGWSCADGSPAGTICTFNLGTLNPGDSGSVTFAVTVDNHLPAGVTQISNSASIADDGTHGLDADSSNNSDGDTTPVEAAPDLVITKDDGFTVVSPGQVITYILTITNVGTQDATGVVVTDTLPANTTFVSASDSGTYDSITGVVTWPAFDLAAGAFVTRTVTIQVNDPFPSTSILNQAHVEDDGSNGSDLTPANNDATDTDSVVTLPNSDLTKSIIATNQGFTPDPSVAIGEMLTYEVTFTVPAGGTMTHLKLTDTLDRGLAFVRCVSVTASGPAITTTLPGGFGDACNDPTNPTVTTEPPGSPNPADAGRKITFTLGDVSNSGASNGTVSVRYTVVVLDSIENQDGVRLNNSATLTWDSGSLSTAAPEVTIVEPDFELTKEADRTVATPGSVITFTLTLRHTNASNVDAFDVVLTDVLPPGLTYVPGSLTIVSGPPGGVTDDTAAPTLRVAWANFPLLTGSSRTQAVVRFQAVLGNLAPGQRVRNTASLEWTSLPGDVSAPQSPYNALSTERYYDPGSNVNVYGVLASLDITVPRLPATGFAPGVVTPLPAQPAEKAYQALGNFWLEIPKLGVKMPIVGIPARGEEWDLTWLWDQAGWLEGTAYPTHAGNSAITAHVYLPNGQPGPFYKLDALRFGDAVIVHLGGQRYVFEVRQVQRVSPNTLSALRHEELPWLTLITCREYDPKTNSYRSRLIVRAVLVKILE